MKTNNQDEAWKLALAKFSKISDGFCIIGYDKRLKQRITYGLNKNAVTADGLFIIQRKAIDWMGGELEDLQGD